MSSGGDISMIDATVNLMESVFTSKIKYDYIWVNKWTRFPTLKVLKKL